MFNCSCKGREEFWHPFSQFTYSTTGTSWLIHWILFSQEQYEDVRTYTVLIEIAIDLSRFSSWNTGISVQAIPEDNNAFSLLSIRMLLDAFVGGTINPLSMVHNLSAALASCTIFCFYFTSMDHFPRRMLLLLARMNEWTCARLRTDATRSEWDENKLWEHWNKNTEIMRIMKNNQTKSDQ